LATYPLYPPPLLGRGRNIRRGAKPLFDSPYSISPFKERGKDIKRGAKPLLDTLLGLSSFNLPSIATLFL